MLRAKGVLVEVMKYELSDLPPGTLRGPMAGKVGPHR